MTALRQPALKSWQLKYWAYLTGLPSTGTKAELQALLIPVAAEQQHKTPSRRILSLDMGIRNLAFCVVEPSTPRTKSGKIALKVSAWKRTDLLESAAEAAEGLPYDASVEVQRRTKREETKTAGPLPKDSFTPAVLSQTAYKVTKDLLSYEPDTMLIERQRFRSGGAAAIQEWTVRVNMLESMLWASLETLRQESRSDTFPIVHAVSPARVVQFWSSAASLSLLPPTLFGEENGQVQTMITDAMSNRRKIEKKDKVEIVRSWIKERSDLDLEFDGKAADIAEAFSLSSRQSKAATELAGGKLDDLADCLLQAVTWLKWEQNRAVLDRLWQKAISDIKSDDEAKQEKQDAVHPFNPEWIAARIAFPGMTKKQTAEYLK